MQSEGGYRYPGATVCVVLSSVAILSTLLVAVVCHMALLKTVALFLNLQGTVLLASAFTPSGLTPPAAGFGNRIRWFLSQEGAVPLKFCQPLFYGGLLSLYLGSLLGAIA